MLKKTTTLFAFIVMLFSIPTASGQSQSSGWAAYIGSFQFKQSKFGLMFDAQVRSSDEYVHLQQYLFRTALTYKFNKHYTASAGYAYVSSYAVINGVSDRVPEHRAFEQFFINHKLGSISLIHRFRNEHRWIATAADPNDFNAQQRFRYFLRGVIPFQRDSVFSKGVFFSFQEEIMFNYINKEVTNNSFFDQNRAFVGGGYRFNSKIDLEVGYMNQLVKQRSGNTLTNNIFQLAIYTRLNL
ncbi:DUF2490 domain-containing protein [Solitalea longa]|uniref:DUF2490 domain-containing protein n=1 Tax=Solitalea longa TaxID=2079460 RepID=A0A2S5A3L8_9SPHI|nr:DUF2490 domain-containing protein [Solitalea longa]POY37114.1 DUF2490 domain-containing protein [Solitalea longa]